LKAAFCYLPNREWGKDRDFFISTHLAARDASIQRKEQCGESGIEIVQF
jgi:hypothetical protein